MMFFSLLAATFTFTATATGVEKGTPIEFVFVGKGSDRDYEALFVLDYSVDAFCRGLERAGFPRGMPEDPGSCYLWPVGCTVEMNPPLGSYLESSLPDGIPLQPIIYTGGTRMADGTCEASTNMPLSAFCVYSLAQSPLVFNGHYEQGNVYNCHRAKDKIEKGTRVTFTLSCNTNSLPRPFSQTLEPGKAAELIKALRDASVRSEVNARIDFSPELTVSEAVVAARALSVIDSSRVKINGMAPGRLFYRAFLPLVKWLDRKERLVQPFELTVGMTNSLVHIDEDWSVEGDDPKLTPQAISFDQVGKFPNTETCFIYVAPTSRLSSVYQAMSELKGSSVKTWYVFERK